MALDNFQEGKEEEEKKEYYIREYILAAIKAYENIIEGKKEGILCIITSEGWDRFSGKEYRYWGKYIQDYGNSILHFEILLRIVNNKKKFYEGNGDEENGDEENNSEENSINNEILKNSYSENLGEAEIIQNIIKLKIIAINIIDQLRNNIEKLSGADICTLSNQIITIGEKIDELLMNKK